MPKTLNLGVDVGSTTVKLVVLDGNKTLYQKYSRHMFDVEKTIRSFFEEAKPFLKDNFITICITGSAGMQVSDALNLPFVQEVVACTLSVKKQLPPVDVILELGGEDAKVVYFATLEGKESVTTVSLSSTAQTNQPSNTDMSKDQKSCGCGTGKSCSCSDDSNSTRGIEARMNTMCAAGTGAFIDQMAALLETDALGLNDLAKSYKNMYTIASRCGVFAKADVQPLLNEGVSKSDVAASVLQAVVNQTISGLACGKPIRGKIAFLGGPLYFLTVLRDLFVETLKLTKETAFFPDDGQFYVARGAAYYGQNQTPLPSSFLDARFNQMSDRLRAAQYKLLNPPLFENDEQLQVFQQRHAKAVVPRGDLKSAKGPIFLGVDCGSTTIKAVLTDKEGKLLWTYYTTHQGNPLTSAITMFQEMYKIIPKDAYLAHALATGYGEHIVKAAFRTDSGLVETVCHLRAARFFQPEVDFVLDIGGQDMKSIHVDQGGIIAQICLNEACSSGCGSFIQTLAATLNLPVSEFSKAGLIAKSPVDLGSRCTVFMNSRIKQAQKDCATVEDISAGLALSIIRNALFKVIRIHDPKDIGNKIVVQGGTFLNDSILRAAEIIFDNEVVRPDIAGHMGAFGAALLGIERWEAQVADKEPSAPEIRSSFLPSDAIDNLTWETQSRRCGKCINNCQLTVHKFSHNSNVEHISGNRCERGLPIEQQKQSKDLFDMVDWHRKRVFSPKLYTPLQQKDAKHGTIGFPRALFFWEEYPLWFTAFTKLGFRVILSSESTDKLNLKGMETIPSEAACFPAKLTHGHVSDLIERKVDAIFIPQELYGRKGCKQGVENYQCALLSTYGAMINNSFDFEKLGIKYFSPALPVYDDEVCSKRFSDKVRAEWPDIKDKDAQNAYLEGCKAYNEWRDEAKKLAEDTIAESRARHQPIAVLAAYPYQYDGIHCGSITPMLLQEGYNVITADAIAHLGTDIIKPYQILNMYTTDGRIIDAAKFVANQEDFIFLYLSSFGCGVTPACHEQCQSFLRVNGRMYANVKIDQALNIGSIRVRIRSLVAAHQQQLALIAAQKKRNALLSPVDEKINQIEKDVQNSPDVSPSPSLSPAVDQNQFNKSSETINKQQVQQVKMIPYGYPTPGQPIQTQTSSKDAKSSPIIESKQTKDLKCETCGGAYDGQPLGPQLIDSFITQGMSKIPKKPYTVFIHNFSFEHGPGYCRGINSDGYNFQVCPDFTQQEMVDVGLRYVNNDCCYGSVLIVGALLLSIYKKIVDPNLLHFCWIHMGGSCSSRCIGFYIRRALIQAGYPQVGVTELNYNYLVNPEMSIGQTMRVNFAFVIGDSLTRCFHRCKPYEKVPGSTKQLWKLWYDRYQEHVEHGPIFGTAKFIKAMVKDFEALPLVTEERTKPRVGIIGTMCKVEPEFYDWMKDYLVDEEGVEITILDFYGYAIAPSYNAMNQYSTYSFPYAMKIGGYVSQKMIRMFIGWGIEAFKNSKRFDPMRHMDTVLERTWSIVPSTHISGEGWFYTSQFIFLLDQGIDNFICTTPFDCMPVHLGCRGAMRKLKQMFPKLNVCVLDFDAGSSRMNQLNRIRLMLNSMPERQNQGPQQTLCRVGDLEDLIGDDDLQSSSSSSSLGSFRQGCSPAACQSCSSSSGCSVLLKAVQNKIAQQTFVGAVAEDITEEIAKAQQPIKA